MAKTVLLVDDNEDLVQVLSARLEAAGYRVLTALDGRDGLSQAKDRQPDLILLDVMMPVMDGFEVLAQLKAEAATRAIPVVMLTARGESKFVFKAEAMGAADYLVKPCESETLLAVTARHVGSHSA